MKIGPTEFGFVEPPALSATWAWLSMRMGRPIKQRTVALCVVGASAIAGATALIWRLTWLGSASLVFQDGRLLLLLAFADGRGGPTALSMIQGKEAAASIDR